MTIADANAAADLGQYERAASLAAQAAASEQSPVLRAKIVQWQLRWSVQAFDAEQTETARRELIAALDAIEDPAQWVRSAHEATVFLADSGLHEDAYKLNRQIVDRFVSQVDGESPGGGVDAANDDGDNSLVLASVLINLGNAEVGLGRHEDALATFARARDTVVGQNNASAANVAYNAAVALAELNQIEAARAGYAQALAIWDQIDGAETDRAYALRGLAACLARTGRSDEALDQFGEAVRIFDAAGEPGEVDLTQVGIMQARQRRDDHFSDAEIDELIATAGRLAPTHRASMLHNIGNLQTKQRDLDAAARTFTDLRRWVEEIGDEISVAKAVGSLAVVERHRSNLAEAIRLNREAYARYTRLGITDGVAHAEHNYALLLDESADRAADPTDARALRIQAADHALAALAAFDRHRHSLPTATDRQRLFLEVYAPNVPATLRICINAERPADVAAVVERSRIQPVLRASGGGFVGPPPVAACRGSRPVGGSGEPIVLGELAESLLGDGALWVGWWTDGQRLVRAWSGADSADADQGPLDRDALSRYSAALPIVDQPDLDAAAGDPRVAAIVATWRSASGPMLADPGKAARAAAALDDRIRQEVLKDDGVREAFEWSADQVLWPLSEMLLSPALRTRLLAALDAGRRVGLVIAPIASFGRIPWAALPLSDPRDKTPRLLVEAADIAVGLPAALARGFGTHTAADADGMGKERGTLVIADPLGDLASARGLTSPGARILGATSLEPATRHHLTHALAQHPRLLAVAGHVRPGTAADPAAAALLLDRANGTADPVLVTELAPMQIPPWCLVLGCDGSGAAVGAEWTGVLTGLAWAGAKEIATSTVPVIDDALTAELDRQLLRLVETDGPVSALLNWQRAMCGWQRDGNGAATNGAQHQVPLDAWEQPDGDSAPAEVTGEQAGVAPYRWATYVATRSPNRSDAIGHALP